MKQRRLFDRPPRERGTRANRKEIEKISQYCFAVAASAAKTSQPLAKQLRSVGKELNVYANTAGKRIYLYPSILALYSCLHSIKTTVELGIDCGDAMAKLVAEEKTLIELLKSGVDSLDDNPFCNKQLRRFMANKQQVQAVYRMAQVNRKIAENAKTSMLPIWAAACENLKKILQSLSDLESFATVSSSLSRKINRVVKPKQLSDFFDSPIRAQAESERMQAQLCFIVKNVNDALRNGRAMESVQKKHIESLPYGTLSSEKKTTPISTSNRTVKKNFDDDDNDLTGAVCVR